MNLEKFNELFGNTRKARDVAVPRLAIQGVTGTDDARRLKAAIVNAGIFLGNSANYIRLQPNADYSQLFFSTLLNSTLIEWRFRLTSSNNNVNNYEVDALPLRRIEFNTPRLDRHKQSRKATDLYGKSRPKGDANEVLNFVEAELQAGRADVVHDLLGFLAERMIEMSEEKRRIARQFVSDLKDFHGIGGGSMNPKTKLHEFWKLEAADVFAHFRRNKVRISQSDEEKIRGRFSKAKSVIVPLDSQIAFTDQLIDQIIYRLYGLTPEEIGIVEDANENR